MIAKLSESVLLRPGDVRPSQSGWEVVGVFNPAVSIVGEEMVMIARVAERPIQTRSGWTALPRWTDSGKAVVDWVCDDDIDKVDARVVSLKPSGNLRLTSISHFQIFRTPAFGSDVRSKPWKCVGALLPEGPLEEYGIENPRITKIESTYWITYVAVSQAGAATALLSSNDLAGFKRHGIIFASENKDVVLFPDQIAGSYIALHRPNPRSQFCSPSIWIARSPDLTHWGGHEPILRGIHDWEGDRVGSGTPPLLVDEGWLTIYHGSAKSTIAGKVGCYAGGALLLDRNNPSRVISRSRDPMMLPTRDCETDGFVPNVVFPTAMLDVDNELQVFYGAADTFVAEARFSKQSVLDSLNLKGNTQS